MHSNVQTSVEAGQNSTPNVQQMVQAQHES